MTIDQVSSAAASNIYKTAQNISGDKGLSSDNDGVSFGNMVKEGVRDTIQSVRQGEQASAAAVTGEADINDVVDAITKAELTLQTVVTVRDRMISAYQDIMRMPI